MSNAVVTISKGHIVDLKSDYIHTDLGESPMGEYFIANRWIGKRNNDNGELVFSCRNTGEGFPTNEYLACKIFPDGVFKVYKRGRSKDKIVIMQERKIADSVDDVTGRLILGGGKIIADRRVEFKESSVDLFIEKHGISSIIKENPNRAYLIPIVEKRYSGIYNSWALFTDGSKQYIEVGGTPMVQVTNATWAIECQSNKINKYSVSLITTEDILDLSNNTPYVRLRNGFFNDLASSDYKKVLWFSRHIMQFEQLKDLGTEVSFCQINKTINSVLNIKDGLMEADIYAIVASLDLERQFLYYAIINDKIVILAECDRDRKTDQIHFNKWIRLNDIIIDTEDFDINSI